MARQKSAEHIKNELYSQLVGQVKYLCQNTILTDDNSVVDPVSDKRHLKTTWIFDHVDPSIIAHNKNHFKGRLRTNPRLSSIRPQEPWLPAIGLMWGEFADQMTTESDTLREIHLILTCETGSRSMPPSAIYHCLSEDVTLARLRSEEAVTAFIQSYPEEFKLDRDGLAASRKIAVAKASVVRQNECYPGLDNSIAHLLQQSNPTDENSRTKRVQGTREGKLFFKIGWVLDRIADQTKRSYSVMSSKRTLQDYLVMNPRFLVNQDCVHVADVSYNMPTEQALEEEIVQLLQANHGGLSLANVCRIMSSNSKLRIRSQRQLLHFLEDKTDVFTVSEDNLFLRDGETQPSAGVRPRKAQGAFDVDAVQDLDKHVSEVVKRLALCPMGIATEKLWSSLSDEFRAAFLNPTNLHRLIKKRDLASEVSQGKLVLRKSRFYTDEMTSNDLISILLRNPLSAQNSVSSGDGTRMYRIEWVAKTLDIPDISASHVKSILSTRPDLFAVHSNGVLLAQTFLEDTKKRLKDILLLYQELFKDNVELEFFPVERAFATNDDMFHTKKKMYLSFFLHYPDLFKLNGAKSGVRLTTEEEVRQHQAERKKSLEKRAQEGATSTTSYVSHYLQHLSPNLILLMQRNGGKVLCHRQSFTLEYKAEVSEEKFYQALIANKHVSVYIAELPAPLHDIKFVAKHAWQGRKMASPNVSDIQQTTLNEWRKFVASNVDVCMQKVDPGLGLLKVGVSPHFALSKSLRLLLAKVSHSATNNWNATDFTQFLVYPELFLFHVTGVSCAYANPHFETVLLKLLLPSELKRPLDDFTGTDGLSKSKCIKVETDPEREGALVLRGLSGYVWQLDSERSAGTILVVAADTQYLVRFSVPAETIDAATKIRIGNRAVFDLAVTEEINNVVYVAVNDLRLGYATDDDLRCFGMLRRRGNDGSNKGGEGDDLVHDVEHLAPLEDDDEEDAADLDAFTLPGPEEEEAAAGITSAPSGAERRGAGPATTEQGKDEKCSLS